MDGRAYLCPTNHEIAKMDVVSERECTVKIFELSKLNFDLRNYCGIST